MRVRLLAAYLVLMAPTAASCSGGLLGGTEGSAANRPDASTASPEDAMAPWTTDGSASLDADATSPAAPLDAADLSDAGNLDATSSPDVSAEASPVKCSGDPADAGPCNGVCCGAWCTYTSVDPQNCGSCAHACASSLNQVCIGGACTCSPADTLCPSGCRNTQADPNNCSGCGVVCATGQSCVAGTCTCPPEQATVCNGACTDLRSDPANCGACNVTCSGATPQCLNGACAPPPDVLVAGQSMPYGVVVDATSIYWTTDVALGGGAVNKADLAGASPVTLAGNQNGPHELVSDGQRLYWNAGVGLGTVPVAGGTVTLTQPTSNQIAGLTLYGSTLYFLSGLSGGNGDENNLVYAMPSVGGAATQLTCCYAQLGHTLATDGNEVYWTDENFVERAAISPPLGPTTQTGTDAQWPAALVRGSTTLYLLNGDGSVTSLPTSGGNETSVAPSSHGVSADAFMVVDSGTLYWTDGLSSGAVRKVAVTGGTVTTLANHQDYPVGIAVDSQYVYWVDHSATGAVMRTAR